MKYDQISPERRGPFQANKQSQAASGRYRDYALSARKYVGSDALEEEWCVRSLKSIAEKIGLSPRESEATIRSGMAAGKNDPKEAKEVFEILDSLPSVIDRPIRLIDNKAYGVTWLPVAVRGSPDGRQITPVVFDDDGSFYSELDIPGSKPLAELGVEIDLPFEIPEIKRLSPLGFKRFISGAPLRASEVFARVMKSIDAFVSFENSVHDQQSMCELVACWTIRSSESFREQIGSRRNWFSTTNSTAAPCFLGVISSRYRRTKLPKRMVFNCRMSSGKSFRSALTSICLAQVSASLRTRKDFER